MIRIKFTALILLIILAGCAKPQSYESATVRLISAAPNITEILFALDLEEEIVGVSLHCNYPDEAKKKARIGTFSHPNIESIIELDPDIVFVTGLEQDPVRDKLKKLGIKTVTIYPKNIEELYQSIVYIGKLTGSSDKASSLVRDIKEEIGQIKEKLSSIPAESRKKILIELMDDPLIVAGENSFVGQLGAIAGGENIAFDTKRAYSKFSPELVVERNPDCIILGYMFKSKDAIERVSNRLGWSNINAVKNGQIFNDINPDILLRPGPRITEAIKKIYAKLYED